MAWVALLSFALLSFGVAAFTSLLTANLEPQPEYPAVMTHALRLLGALIALAGVIFAAVLLGYAAVAYFGLD